ncbi:MAG: hypothetical protein IH614_14300 [Desulfuromonadales bacterium]|nr:hypothetical protein [Desulfuromonadales bacterium]
MPVFITDLATFLPHAPAAGAFTHTNAQLAAEAVRRLHPCGGFTPDAIELLTCATSSPDQLGGHASMLRGELGSPPCEIVATAETCSCGMTAFNHAWMNVARGRSGNAVAVGSARASSDLPALLCGGAGAAFFTASRPAYRQALRVDWVDQLSFVNEPESCLDTGAIKEESDDFRQELYDQLRAIGFEIPADKWNAGAASIYIILEELFHSGRLRIGDRLFCLIPETDRFSIGYMQLTVV